MAKRVATHFCLLLILACILATSNGAKLKYSSSSMLNRSSFPAGFVFGAGSSAYQSEGAAFQDGRAPSIWDTFTHTVPGLSLSLCFHRVDRFGQTLRIFYFREYFNTTLEMLQVLPNYVLLLTEKIDDHSTGDIADEFYHRFKEDLILIKSLGFDAFRFSISWSRLLPEGNISGGVNSLGVQFYNNLIDEVLSNGLQPYVTLYHWDLPQALADYYGGWLSPKIIHDYVDYADLCFATFGDRVKHWITLNEPFEFTLYGYAYGSYAPGRCSNYIGNCMFGNSATEPYIVGHLLILSHAAAVKLYREKYKASQKGQIGVTLQSKWFVPFSKNTAGRDAAQRALDFMLGWVQTRSSHWSTD